MPNQMRITGRLCETGQYSVLTIADGRIISVQPQDKNHNGISEADELHTLPSVNVAVFELDYKASNKIDGNGNHFKYRAKVRNGKGQQLGRWAWDVYLVKAL
jgi:hypothetical protein